MSRIAIKPIEPLILEFGDDTEKIALFNTETFIIMQSEFGSLLDLVNEKELKNKPYDIATKILYCALKQNDSSTTYEETMAIMAGGGLPLLNVVLEKVAEVYQGIENGDNEIVSKKDLAEAEKVIANLMK